MVALLHLLLLASPQDAQEEPFRLALAHAYKHLHGSSRLRVDMLASAINQRRAHIEQQVGFRIDVRVVHVGYLRELTARILDSSLSAAWPDGARPHALVSVKSIYPERALSLLAERCILACTDVLDQTNITDLLIRARGLLGKPLMMPPAAGLPRPLFIVQTHATVAHIEARRPSAAQRPRHAQIAPLLAVVPHQHTNVGRWRVRPPAESMRPIRRIGVLVGDPLNMPSRAETLQLAAAACEVLASLVVISENVRAGSHTRLSTYGCDSARRVVLPPRVARGGDHHPPAYSGELADSAGFSMSAQAAYHALPWVRQIDLGLLWPAPAYYASSAIESRPVTRLLFWWTHGVPTVFYPFAAYVEAALEANYSLPPSAGERGPAGAGAERAEPAEPRAGLPSAASPEEFSRVLRRLVVDPPARRLLAEAGLRAVERYSPAAIGARLLSEVHGAWRELQGDGSLCRTRSGARRALARAG